MAPPPLSPAPRPAPRAVRSPAASCPIRLLIVDDQHVLREGLKTVLEDETDLEIIGEAEDGAAAVEMAVALRPDIVLMDVSMPKMNGIEATRRICEQHLPVKVIGLSLHENDGIPEAMLAAGAVAYLVKGGPILHLLATIRQNAPAT